MSSTPIAPQKLRGKWFYLIVSVLLIPNVFLPLFSSLFEAGFSLYEGFFFYSSIGDLFNTLFYGSFDTDNLFYVFNDLAAAITVNLSTVPFILCLLPFVTFVLYVLEGYKLRRGNLLVSLTILLLPLYPLYFNSVITFSHFGDNDSLSCILEIFLENPHLLAAMALAALYAALCLLAALAVAFIPKIGRFIAAVCLIFTLFSPIAVVVISYLPYFFEMLEELYVSTTFLSVLIVPCSTISWLTLPMIVMLFINRIPSLFDKPKAAKTVAASNTPAVEAPAVETPAVEVATEETVSTLPTDDMVALYKLRADDEISAEEYRRLCDALNAK